MAQPATTPPAETTPPGGSGQPPGRQLPLIRGATGPEVEDLQARLAAAGFDVDGDDHGCFGDHTESALQRFQATRGLMADGACDRHTWAAVVEASFRLGDRLLYLRRPMFRGDDVVDLQARLGGLGFDAGRVDGIFGPDTERALRDFQHNTGLTIDGVCGPDVTAALRRLGEPRTSGTAVAGVRERERLRQAPRELAGRRLAIGECGGLDALAHAIARHLHDEGSQVAVLQHPDPSVQASQANEFEADLFVHLSVGEPPCWTSYYATVSFESVGGHRLADLLSASLHPLDVVCDEPRPMRLPVLRETRMPAVVVHLGPPSVVVLHTADVARATLEAVRAWVTTPLDR
ncbi:MAG: peptidoglycan-binding protein [Acidimicrobiia bacterium]|nr:peptidoglycan-binding protein [Acidimicrobiia bacterium]